MKQYTIEHHISKLYIYSFVVRASFLYKFAVRKSVILIEITSACEPQEKVYYGFVPIFTQQKHNKKKKI